MKKQLLVPCLFALAMMVGRSVEAQVAKDPRVPQEAWNAFTASFVVEDGLFRGAYVGPLTPYLSEVEIAQLIRQIVQTQSADASCDCGPKIYHDKRPISRGCKPKNRWVCVVYGQVVE